MSPRQTKGGERPFSRVAVQCPQCLRESHRADRIGVLFEGRTVPRNGGPPASVLSCGDCGHRWHGPPVAELKDYASRGPVQVRAPEERPPVPFEDDEPDPDDLFG